MPVINSIIKELDRCIGESQRLFERELFPLQKVRQEHRGKELISFSTGGSVKGLCLNCNKKDVTYSINGSWTEGSREGLAEVKWTCNICGRKYNYQGPRGEVIGQLSDITPPLAA